jgi:hypothetical protein
MRASILAVLSLLLADSQDPSPAPVPAVDVPALLDRLDASFAALGRFRAEYDVKGIPSSEDGPDLSKIVLHVDLPRSAGLVRMHAGGAKEPCINSQFEGWTVYFWKDSALTQKSDLSLFGRFVTMVKEFEGGVDRLVGRDGGQPWHPIVLIRIDGKPDKDRKGNFRFAMGTASGRTASWIREAAAPDAVLRRAGDAIRVELPSARKEFEIDASTGLLRRLCVRDYDGTARELVLTAFAKGEEAPDPGRPGKVKSQLPSPEELATKFDELYGDPQFGTGALGRAWPRIDAEKREPEAKALLAGFYGSFLHFWVDYALQSYARQYLGARMAKGATAAELKQNADLEFEGFAASLTQGAAAKQLGDFIQDRATRFQHGLRKSLNSALADEKNAEALVKRTLDAACADPKIDSGPALLKRARQAFDLVVAHAEEL